MSNFELLLDIIEIKQRVGSYYIASIRTKDLLEISSVDRMRMEQEGDSRASYLGIQRKLDEARVKKIAEYVKNRDSAFPTSILLAITEDCAEIIQDETGLHLKLKDFYKYLRNGKLKCNNNQIKEEIDYCFKKYNLKPKIFIAYDRLSYYDTNNKDFRITFDTFIRSRESDLYLELGDCGKLLDEKQIIMETKSLNAYPLWFSEILSSLHIYPKSYSKYGNIYKKMMKEGNVYV